MHRPSWHDKQAASLALRKRAFPLGGTPALSSNTGVPPHPPAQYTRESRARPCHDHTKAIAYTPTLNQNFARFSAVGLLSNSGRYAAPASWLFLFATRLLRAKWRGRSSSWSLRRAKFFNTARPSQHAPHRARSTPKKAVCTSSQPCTTMKLLLPHQLPRLVANIFQILQRRLRRFRHQRAQS